MLYFVYAVEIILVDLQSQMISSGRELIVILPMAIFLGWSSGRYHDEFSYI